MAIDFLSHLRSDATRFADVMRDADPAARVPTCPEWDGDDLLWHLAEVFLFWGTIVRDRLDDPDPADAGKPPRPVDHAGLLELYDAAATDLISTLADTADEVHVWTWSGDETAGFVRRRMAQEAMIHRLDAELTTGAVTDFDPALAADGVHEALLHFYGGYPEWAAHHADGPTGRLRAIDTGDEWTFQVGRFSGLSPNTGKTYDDEASLELVATGRPSFTLSGTARDLDAWLWNRPTVAGMAVEGNDADYRVLAQIIAKGVE